jgi:hypothetical protein
METVIKNYEDVALSNGDIMRLLNGKVNIELYPNLYKYSNLDELLGPYGACVLLFEAKPKYGHWVCIFKQNSDLIEFFNPYGGFPDDSLLYINRQFRKESRQEYPILSQLLLDCPYELSYNEFQFQRKNKNVKTCGRHCVVRLMFRNLNLYEYKDLLDQLRKKYHTDYDGVVTYLTI